MVASEQDRNRWTIKFGGDAIVIERTPAGLFPVRMPERREAIGSRAQLTALRDACDAALRTGARP